MNNSTTNRVELLVGFKKMQTHLYCIIWAAAATSGACAAGIGLDSTTVDSSIIKGLGLASNRTLGEATYTEFISIGYHYLQLLEYATAGSATTIYGDNNVSYIQSGGVGWHYA